MKSLWFAALSLAGIGSFMVAGLFAGAAPAQAAAGINKTLNFQGRLLNGAGAVVPDGNYNIRFKIYQDGPGNVAGDTGGSLMWTELWQNSVASGSSSGVTVKNGYFSVNLGSFCAFSGGSCQGGSNTGIDFDQDTLWMSMDVGGTAVSNTPTYDGEMLPMRRLASSVYALQAENANKLGGLTASQFLQTVPASSSVNVIAPTAASTVALTVKASTAGSTNSLEVFDSSGSRQDYFDANGSLNVAKTVQPTVDNTVDIGLSNTQFRTGYFGTSVITPLIDTNTASALNIGTTNATVINLNQNSVVAAGRSLTVTGGTTASRPSGPSEGAIYYDTTTKSLLTYANGKWQADRVTATKTVAMGAATGCTGTAPVASSNPDAADFVSTSCTSSQNTINSAIAALPANGGTVYLAEGTYIIDGAIPLPKNISLVGAGNNTILKLKDGINANQNLLTNVVGTNAVDTGVVVQNLVLDGNKANNSSGTQYGFTTSANTSTSFTLNMQNVTITNFRNDGLYVNGSGFQVEVSNSTFSNNGGYGLYLATTGSSIAGNNITGNTNGGIYLSSSVKISITNNYIASNAGAGIDSLSPINSTITGNTVAANTGNGIQVWGQSGNVVSANTVNGNGGYGIRYRQSDFASVTGNTVSGNSSSGIYMYGSDDSVVSGNKVHDNGGTLANSGIQIGYTANRMLIIGNNITDTAGTGYAIDVNPISGTGIVLSNNIFSGTGASSIHDTTSDTTYVDQTDGSGHLITKSLSGVGMGTSSVTSSLTLQGSMATGALPAPSNVNVSKTGTAGTTTDTYVVTALDGQGETTASASGTIATANATLSGTNYNTIFWNPVPGALSYKIYRTAAGGTPNSTGYIGTVTAGPAALVTTTSVAQYSFNDTGLAASGSVPTVNTTGGVTAAGLLQANAGLTAKTATNGVALQVQNSSSAAVVTVDTSSNLLNDYGSLNLAGVAGPGSAPTVAVGAAGSLSGTYYYVVAYVTASGTTSYGPVSSAVSPASQQVNLTSIPVSPSGLVAGRKIYRGTSNLGPFSLVTTINDNSTTTYSDNVTSLGAQASADNATSVLKFNGQTALNVNPVNVWLGVSAGVNNASGQYDVAVGTNALAQNTTGSSNAALGPNALYSNTTGTGNTASGSSALYGNTTGTYNVALGLNTLQSNTAGSYNTAVGMSALNKNTASSNTAIGHSTLQWNTTGNQNAAMGESALYNNTTGSSNTASGVYALQGNTTGYYNTANGAFSLYNNTTGYYNTASGYNALNGLSSMSGNITATANNGGNAQFTTSNTTGLAVGSQVTISGTSSYNGTKTIASVDSGTTFTITTAYATADTGSWSTASTDGNTATGYAAGGTGQYAAGYNSLFGYQAGTSLKTSGSYNTLVGANAGFSVSSGQYNVALGYQALQGNTTGSYNTALGYQANMGSGNLTNATAIGYSASVSQSNSLVLGGTGANAVKVGIGTTAPTEALNVVGNFDVQDAVSVTKQYRFRTSGSNLDLEGSGASLFMSVWSGATFGGTQHNKLVLENSSDNTQAIRTWQFRDTPFGTLRHTIDGTIGNSVTFNQDSEATNFTVQGQTDANLLFVQGSTNRVGIGTNAPGYKLDVNGTVKSTGLTVQTAVNSTTAFQVLTSTNVPILTVDTSTPNVTVNALTSLTGTPAFNYSDGSLELGCVTSNCWSNNVNGTIGFLGMGVQNGQIAWSPGSGFYLCDSSSSNASGNYGQCATRAALYGGNISSNGNVTIQPATDSTAALAVKTAAGASLFAADTVNSNLVITSPSGNASLGSALVATGSAVNDFTTWTTTGWSASATAASHTSGNTSALTSGWTPTIGATYSVQYSYTSCTSTNSLGVSMGGVTLQNSADCVGSTTHVLTATSAAPLAFTPSSTYTGTVSSVTIKQVTPVNSVLTVKNNSGVATLEVRSTGDTSNLFMGLSAGSNNTSSGVQNTAYGNYAFQSNTTGLYATAIGAQALQNNSTGNSNTAVGNNALQSNTSGGSNVAVGSLALPLNQTGGSNVAVGTGSLRTALSASNNTAIGTSSLYSTTTGGYNSGLGYGTLFNNTTGIDSSAVGYSALYSSTTGSYNTALGYQALYYNTTGFGNTAIGYNAGYQDSGNKMQTLATLQNATAIGSYAQVQANNSIVLGSVDNGTKVGVGITVPTNTFSVSPLDYQSGSVTRTNGSATLVGTGTTWTSAMVGDLIVFADGTTNTVSAFTDSLHITMGTTYTGTTDSSAIYYRFHKVGLQVVSSGATCIGTTSCTHTLGVSGTIAASGAITASSTPDLAETIAAADDVTAADVVMADPTSTERVVKASGAYTGAAVGVISDGTSSFMINAHGGTQDALTGKPLVLAGRVPVKVTNEGGAVAPGDYLTTSSTPGFAMKATHAGPTIGKALGFFDGTSGTVLVLVNVSYADPVGAVTSKLGSNNFQDINVGGNAEVAMLTVSGAATIAGDLTVGGTAHVADLVTSGHLATTGAVPGVTAGAAACVGATVTISGTDTAGTITVTTASAAKGCGATGTLAAVKFAKAFGAAPRVILTANDKEAAKLQYNVDSAAADGFNLQTQNAVKPAKTYTYNFFTIQ